MQTMVDANGIADHDGWLGPMLAIKAAEKENSGTGGLRSDLAKEIVDANNFPNDESLHLDLIE